jgi:CRISPR system Cascade subunit CasC
LPFSEEYGGSGGRSADRTLASQVVRHLTHLIATVSPGAKLGSTAPYSYADLMLIEAGSRQPRSLANAYREAVPAQMSAAAQALCNHLERLDDAYGTHETRRFMSVDSIDIPGAQVVNLDRLADWAASVLLEGEVA